MKQTGEYVLAAILYVDDLILLSSNVIQLKWFKLEFEKEIEINDLGKLHYCILVKLKKIERPAPSPLSKRILLRRFSMV